MLQASIFRDSVDSEEQKVNINANTKDHADEVSNGNEGSCEVHHR